MSDDTSLRSPVRASLILYGAKLGGIVISAITLALTARYLSLSLFGSYSTALAYSGIVVSLLDFGVGWIAARELATGNRAPLTALRSWKYAVTLIGLLISIGVLPFLGYGSAIQNGIIAIIPFTFFTAINSFQIGLLQGISALERTSISDTVGKLVNLALTLLVVKFDLGFIALLAVQNIIGLIIVVINGVQLRARGVIIKGFNISGLRIYKNDLLAMPLITTASYLIYRSDMLLLARFAPSLDVGIYAAAYKIIDVAISVPAILIATVLPILTRAIHNNDPKLPKFLIDSYRLSSVLGATLCFTLILLAPVAIHVVGGNAYATEYTKQFGAVPFTSVRVLQFLAGYVFLSFIGSLLSGILLAAQKRKAMLLISAVGLSFSIGVNVLLIPHFSYLATTLSTIATELVLIIGMLSALSGKKFLEGFFSSFASAFIALILSLFLYFSLGSYSPVLASLVSSLVFCAILWISGTKREHEIAKDFFIKKLYGR